jgi:hypothetical protein
MVTDGVGTGEERTSLAILHVAVAEEEGVDGREAATYVARLTNEAAGQQCALVDM